MNTFAPELNEGVDHHLPVHGTGDLDAPLEQVGTDRGDGPVALANVARLGEEIGELAGVDLQLALVAPLEQLLARVLEAPRQHGEKGDRVAAQHALAPRRGRLEDVYCGLDRGHV